MATLFVRHDVSDFDRWKKAYDEFAEERKSMGVTGDGVFQTKGDPNNVTVYHEFETMDAAEAFTSNPRLLAVMKEGGIVGPPSVWYASRV